MIRSALRSFALLSIVAATLSLGSRVEAAPPAPAPAAGVALVDCVPWASKDNVKCSVPSQAGTVGTGPKFSGGLTTSVNHGFVSGNQLILAVELTASDDDLGGIFGVDLTTGNRTLLSGKLKDPVNGAVSKGTGPSLNMVRDVAPAPNGSWVAFTSAGFKSGALVSIDPATGNRKVFFDVEKSPACVGMTSKTMLDYASGIAVGSDNATYAVVNNNPQGAGKGIAKITPDGKCSILTMSGSTLNTNKGGGPDMIGSTLAGLTFRNESLYILQFNTHSSILAIDPKTGNRKMISVNPDKGTGPEVNSNSMAIAPDGTFWTFNAVAGLNFGLVSVDATTGNRTQRDAKGGPAKAMRETDRGVYVHPNGKNLILQYGKALVTYDPATGNSNVLSY